jgi:hypothetical protein
MTEQTERSESNGMHQPTQLRDTGRSGRRWGRGSEVGHGRARRRFGIGQIDKATL